MPSVRSSVIFAATTVAVFASCSSPREKDCKVVLPLIEESRRARAGGPMDAGIALPKFAERPRRTTSALRSLSLRDPGMKPAVNELADANERFAATMAALDQFVVALRIKPGAPTAFTPNYLDTLEPHTKRIAERCGFIFRTEQQRALPDCIALEQAFEQCVTPATDDINAEEQLLTCATAVDRVHSDDRATKESIRQLAAKLRDLEPIARNIGAPAKEVIHSFKQLGGVFGKQSAALTEMQRAEEAILELCQPRR